MNWPKAMLTCISLLGMIFVACGCNKGDDEGGGGQGSGSGTALTITTTNLLDGSQGVSYSAIISATGGSSQGYTWSLEGIVPPGFTVAPFGTPATTLSGTPGVAGNLNFFVRVTDSQNHTVMRALSLTVNPPSALQLTTTSLPGCNEGDAYSQAIAGSGGSGNYTWSVIAGELPPGFAMGPTGSPATSLSCSAAPIPGNFAFTVQVTDSLSSSASRSFQIVVTAQMALTVSTTSLPDAYVGVTYLTRIYAEGGTQSGYGWQVTAGGVPGMMLAGSDYEYATFGGTPASVGSYSITFTLSDGVGTSVTRTLFISVLAQAPLTISTSSLPTAAAGSFYSATLTGAGGVGLNYQWYLDSGSLPPGLGIALMGTPSTTLSGTPSASGTYNFTIRLQDGGANLAYRNFDVTVSGGAALAIATTSLPVGTATVYYQAILTGSGGSGLYSWTITGLPSGMTDQNGHPQAVICGRPSVSGSFVVNVTLYSGTQNVSAPFTLDVMPAPALPRIDTNWIPEGHLNQGYAASISASGGSGAGYTWAVSQGILPPGVNLAVATGANAGLAGTPTSNGLYYFSLSVTDSGLGSATQGFALRVISGGFEIVTTSLPAGMQGGDYSAQIFATGGTGQGYLWDLFTGALPPGLSLSLTGTPAATFSGTPLAQGSYSFTLRVRDSALNSTVLAYNMNILGSSTLQITTTTLPACAVGAPYRALIAATGGSGLGYTWSINFGGVPPGTVLAQTGAPATILEGVPLSGNQSNFEVRVVDSLNNSALRSFVITPGGSLSTPSIPPLSMPGGTVGTPYSASVSASGGAGTSRLWSLLGGTLPPGVNLAAGPSASGAISGTPTSAGGFSFTVRMVDELGMIAAQMFVINVGQGSGSVPPLYVNANFPNAQVGQSYSAPVTGSGGAGGYGWTVTAGALPPGISLASTGTPSTLLSGVPTQDGRFEFSVTVTDAAAQTAVIDLVLYVMPSASGPLVIFTHSLHAGSTGAPYSATVKASGAGQTNYTFSIVWGALPPGIALAQQGLQCGLQGTCNVAGIHHFVIKAEGAGGLTDFRAFTIVIQ